MEYPIAHHFLAHSLSGEAAGLHVQHYLAGSQLIRYADFIIRQEEILNGKDALFWPTLDQGVAANIAFARRMLEHLKKEGIATLDQLLELQQGYATKVLHTLTHQLDGFIGIDSVFYNLVEDSHRVSEELQNAIRSTPTEYWLIPVRAGELASAILQTVD